MSVEAATAQWLRSNALFAIAENAGIIAAWGDLATVSEIISPLALKADALAEATRQHNFLLSAIVVDKVEVPRARADLIGRRVDLFADRAGYENGQRVFVIGVEEQPGVDRTMLTVLRRLT